MKYSIYWLISENRKKTYVGFSDDLNRRISEHARGIVKTTKAFGKFRCFKIDEAEDLQKAREKERHWKSAAGRRKLKVLFGKL